MGHDVHAICNHRLNTGSIESLAKDLSDRFDVTVDYGYFNHDEVADEQESYLSLWVSFGTIEKHQKPIWRLEDFIYLNKINNPSENENIDVYLFYDKNDYDGEGSFTVLKHCFDPSICFDSRWWYFCKHFTGEEDDTESITQFRNQVKSLTLKLGGDAAIYVDDQGPSSIADTWSEQCTFEQVHTQLQAMFGTDYLNISAFNKTASSATPKPSDKYFAAYYDDFSDL